MTRYLSRFESGQFWKKLIPAILITGLAIWCYDFWWQTLDPFSYYQQAKFEYISVCFPTPRYATFFIAFTLTVLIGFILSAFFGSRRGYHIVTWTLIILIPISLIQFWPFLIRLWNYGHWIYLDGEVREIPLTTKEKLNEIYLPILFNLVKVVALFSGLWIWTREKIKSEFLYFR
ncbi:hypothetical protein [Flavilitoribacter nigricans]|uniref:Uncharacterized protein n=1 Tax=Flavilitoribacter nigricans (strain ATCC 23147 / DSM 23189 / NBRC 102662 / NCIMB 1420 / SS-2) TaxID=1122177 RepID=A0A2D0N3E1_FLAN2|nr:hypothetical protein [Flavilitoribacter nigricans]PHN02908.1 hypothetical protein CRP01_29305 [Flavilitoribacter nigricans DSM 23189 = NBRC 102662]